YHAEVWDAKTGALLGPMGDQDDARTYSIAVHPQREIMATGGFNGVIAAWDPTTRKLLRTIGNHGAIVVDIAFSPDGSRLATCGADQTIKLWDFELGEELLTLAGHGRPVCAVSFSPDGWRLASGGDDGSIRLWDSAVLAADPQPQGWWFSYLR